VIAVVLDTNTLVSGLGWSGPPARIVDAGLAGELSLVSSPALLAELRRVLAYPKLVKVFGDPAGLAALVAAVVELVEPDMRLQVVADEADNRVLEAAITARVDAIVTGDSGLLELGSYDGVPILTAAGFIAEYLQG
jgi:putative PIN family toxin of toxin-antitoxin system